MPDAAPKALFFNMAFPEKTPDHSETTGDSSVKPDRPGASNAPSGKLDHQETKGGASVKPDRPGASDAPSGTPDHAKALDGSTVKPEQKPKEQEMTRKENPPETKGSR